ncbi:dihydrofolate reductase family protein [Microbacterium sp. ASV49]|uniref:Dihydrofolate reductase family protein n=1 Tax=Microbacterium candidum TaxID=3041922 RepID=A0ABT7N327_9MICO|nr:dihydrofolate reductase family protein [Microbacterium sp. ASV49]MDL9981104.1 dihydrofolate reductase family protein [Microbacterium sp. ASV49]
MTLRDDYAVPEGEGPHVRINVVSSIDGAATVDGHSGGLGDAADRETMQALRANADVVLVGAGTILAEGYGGMQLAGEDAAWRVMKGVSAQPRIAVLSGSLSVPAQHPVFVEAVVRPLLLTRADAAEHAEVADVLVFADLRDAIEQLAQTAGRRILCEGGPTLFGALAGDDLVDEVCLTLSPHLVGGQAPRVAAGTQETVRRMTLRDVRRVGDELFLRYVRP